MTIKLKPLSQTLAECSDAHHNAMIDARRECRVPFFQSRGRFINLVRADGKPVDGTEGEARPWKGTVKDLVAAIERAEREGNVVAEVWISCGINAAETLAGFGDGDYDPWVAEWDVRADVAPGAQS